MGKLSHALDAHFVSKTTQFRIFRLKTDKTGPIGPFIVDS